MLFSFEKYHTQVGSLSWETTYAVSGFWSQQMGRKKLDEIVFPLEPASEVRGVGERAPAHRVGKILNCTAYTGLLPHFGLT